MMKGLKVEEWENHWDTRKRSGWLKDMLLRTPGCCALGRELLLLAPLVPPSWLAHQTEVSTAGIQCPLCLGWLFTDSFTLTALPLGGDIREQAPSNETSHAKPGAPSTVWGSAQCWRSSQLVQWLRQGEGCSLWPKGRGLKGHLLEGGKVGVQHWTSTVQPSKHRPETNHERTHQLPGMGQSQAPHGGPQMGF